MKKQSVFSLWIILMITSLCHAGDFRDAATICETMDFNNAKNKCLSTVRANERDFFDLGAISVCKSMVFDNGKNTCVSVIANKIYESFEVSHCHSQAFDSGKNSCLQAAGKRYQHPGRPRLPHPPQNQYSEDYLRGEVSSWERAGDFTAPKGLVQMVTINLDSSRAVSQIRLSSDKAEAQVMRALGVTASGAYIELPSLTGTVLKGNTSPRRVHPNYAIRLQRLELEVVSKNVLGSRARVEVLIGYTR